MPMSNLTGQGCHHPLEMFERVMIFFTKIQPNFSLVSIHLRKVYTTSHKLALAVHRQLIRI